MVRFWEGSRSPSGSCGSRNFLKKDNFEMLWMILLKFSGNVKNGTRNKWLDFGCDPGHCLGMDFDDIFRICQKW